MTAGFGLVELMVSISIMAIVLAIVFVRQGSFNGAILLRGQAYEVAFNLREIQLNAVSADGNGGIFRSVLGLHFDTDFESRYKIFKDADGDAFYDTGEDYGLQGILDNRFEIRDVRVVGDTMTGTGISVVFVRPNFDARFFDSSGEVNASSVEIDVARRDSTGTDIGSLRTIEVTSTGQIAVQ